MFDKQVQAMVDGVLRRFGLGEKEAKARVELAFDRIMRAEVMLETFRQAICHPDCGWWYPKSGEVPVPTPRLVHAKGCPLGEGNRLAVVTAEAPAEPAAGGR